MFGLYTERLTDDLLQVVEVTDDGCTTNTRVVYQGSAEECEMYILRLKKY